MRKPKWKVEYSTLTGDKIKISLEGNFDQEKIKQLFDLIELFDSSNQYSINHDVTQNITSHTSNRGLKQKILILLNDRFKNHWFTSKDVVKAYHEKYGEQISLNVISTYLSRLYYSNVLIRAGSRAKRKYQISQKMML